MKLNKCIKAILLSLMIISLLPVQSMAKGRDTVYQYPIVPGTSEWIELSSLEEKIQACQIPQEVIDWLSTDDLVISVIDYPFAANVLAYETPKEGIIADVDRDGQQNRK